MVGQLVESNGRRRFGLPVEISSRITLTLGNFHQNVVVIQSAVKSISHNRILTSLLVVQILQLIK